MDKRGISSYSLSGSGGLYCVLVDFLLDMDKRGISTYSLLGSGSLD